MPLPGRHGRRRLPQEYFLAEDPAKLPDWRFWEEGPFAAGHDVSDRDSYLALAYRLGTTPNGVFGAKIHWNNLRWALAKFSEMPRFAGLARSAILHTAFPNLRVVDVTRRDRVRQAVSWARMAQDGMWVAPADQPEPAWPPATGAPRYDYGLIAGLEALIADSETGWRQLYHELGRTPYQVVYEELSSPDGYEQTIRGVLAHLGLDDYEGPIPPPDAPSVQRPERGLGGRLPHGHDFPPGALTREQSVPCLPAPGVSTSTPTAGHRLRHIVERATLTSPDRQLTTLLPGKPSAAPHCLCPNWTPQGRGATIWQLHTAQHEGQPDAHSAKRRRP